MKTNLLFSNKAWQIDLKWSKAKKIENFKKNPDDRNAWFYAFYGKYGQGTPKLFYIGRVIKERVSERIKHVDHVSRKTRFHAKYKRHILLISIATAKVLDGGIVTTKRILDIEALLIYSHAPEFNKYLKKWPGKWDEYMIHNSGWIPDIYRHVWFGAFGSD